MDVNYREYPGAMCDGLSLILRIGNKAEISLKEQELQVKQL